MSRTNVRLDAMMLEKGYVKVSEAVKMTKMSPSALYAAMDRGDLASRNVGVRRFVEINSLKKYCGEFCESETS